MRGFNITAWDEARVRDHIRRADATTDHIMETARATGIPWLDILNACSEEAEVIVAVWGAPMTRWGVEIGLVKGAPLLDQETVRAQSTGAKSVPLRTMYVRLANRDFAMAHAVLMGDDKEMYPGIENEIRAH